MRCLDSIPALADDPISALRDDRVDDQNPALFDDRQHNGNQYTSDAFQDELRFLGAR
ncbi:hypothetical protein [Myxococcus sp. NMCA1]|uniref:hypothetical protein n=1 Tax=Myxococcus sp. NMCA1 TaxID=2996785 RepID=UPI0022863F85|nr:hypothetical protein [Myxococcus sp. NMCA1]WAM29934.1 hypothetical protein OZ403_18095 [Myxococcus sp. NMCA1]